MPNEFSAFLWRNTLITESNDSAMSESPQQYSFRLYSIVMELQKVITFFNPFHYQPAVRLLPESSTVPNVELCGLPSRMVPTLSSCCNTNLLAAWSRTGAEQIRPVSALSFLIRGLRVIADDPNIQRLTSTHDHTTRSSTLNKKSSRLFS